MLCSRCKRNNVVENATHVAAFKSPAVAEIKFWLCDAHVAELSPSKWAIRKLQANRLGRFSLDWDAVRNWEELINLFAMVVPVSATCRYDTRTIDYIAYSNLFEIVPQGCEAPHYNITFKRVVEDGKTVQITAIRKED